MQRFRDIEQDEKVHRFVQACRDRGLSVTHQRLAIYSALASAEIHPNAEQLFEAVREQYPTISLATVYKTLDTFEEIGLVSKVSKLHDAARYDANLDRHHHLVCNACHQVFDYYDADLANLPMPLVMLGGQFEVHGYQIQVNGLCADCKKRAASESGDR